MMQRILWLPLLLRHYLAVFPNSIFEKREHMTMKDITTKCLAEEYTDAVVVNENKKIPNAITLMHFPNGPTAVFRLSGIILRKRIPNAAKPSASNPEVILNNFSLRLGHIVCHVT